MERYGEEALHRLFEEYDRSRSLEDAVSRTLGIPFDAFEGAWMALMNETAALAGDGDEFYALFETRAGGKVVTSIACVLSTPAVVFGEEATITVALSPPVAGANVSIALTAPDGSKSSTTRATGSDGAYTVAFAPDQVGAWRISALWEGDAGHTGAVS